MRPTLAILATLALFVPSAQALYVQTPLMLSSDVTLANVGTIVNFTIGPDTDDAQAWADKSAQVVYAVPGADGNYVVVPLTELTLDGGAKGTFSWTIPSEANDQNVDIRVMSGETLLAVASVAVGDAPPIMYAAGGGPADSGPLESGVDATKADSTREAPGIAMAGGLLALALVALALQRK